MKFMVQGSAGVRGSVHFGLSYIYWAVQELDSFIADTRCTKHSFQYNYTTMIVFKQFKTKFTTLERTTKCMLPINYAMSF